MTNDVQSAVVIFTHLTTHHGRKQIEAVLGTFPDSRSLLIKQAISNPKLWNVYRPGRSYTQMHGPTFVQQPMVLAVNLTLREAKHVATRLLTAGDTGPIDRPNYVEQTREKTAQ